jgi:hypothetical protein
MLEVPFTSDYDQRFVTQFGGEKYVFDARWNERGKTWSFDLTRDSDQVLLLAGAPMQIGQDCLAPYALGAGALVFTDLSRKNTDAGPEDMGKRVAAFWLSPQEVADIKAALGPQGVGIVASGVVPPIVPAGGGGGSGATVGSSTTVVNNITNVTNNFSGTGGQTFGDTLELDNDSGDEILIYRDVLLPGMNANPTIALALAIIARGDGIVRVYSGGTLEAVGSSGTPSGSLRGSASVTAEDLYDITSAAFANPGGMMLVKVTMQSSAPATSVGVATVRGVMT